MQFSRFKAAFDRAGRHDASIIAAGIAYYAFLALVPMLAACVLAYGVFADPDTVANHIRALADNLPQSAADLIAGQLRSVTQSNDAKAGLGLLAALALALFGTRNAGGAVARGLTIAFETGERRGFLRSQLVAIGITIAGVSGIVLVAVTIAAVVAIENGIGQYLGYAVLLGGAILGSGALYRLVPHGVTPTWREVMPGAVFFAIGWLVLTAAFGAYVANFGNYNATFGALGGVIVLLTWFYLSAYLLLIGAELVAADRAAE
ncbi:YihY/virulence factor BrkB family protein [Alteriqipengyuania sp. WL0013]|uniref:YihY/virulence factor BrkB family protein n=1 Tax=Alteriqipengyuania sp. WL0013 TaxID=3110773 RepID=UPI002CAEF329|nr:YihY/virulence factor BrkB family protein [Alteriqipengyuania sp. WL0013]MEB3416314.1 YihY/virulence factor BrkB family protein [Alteriqipengyuania sp. WL0013]